MGEGLAKLEAQYGKISWTQFDLKLKWGTLNNYAKAGFTVSKLDQDAKAAAAAAASGEVAKLRTEAFAVRDMADQTAKEYGKNPAVQIRRDARQDNLDRSRPPGRRREREQPFKQDRREQSRSVGADYDDAQPPGKRLRPPL